MSNRQEEEVTQAPGGLGVRRLKVSVVHHSLLSLLSGVCHPICFSHAQIVACSIDILQKSSPSSQKLETVSNLVIKHREGQLGTVVSMRFALSNCHTNPRAGSQVPAFFCPELWLPPFDGS